MATPAVVSLGIAGALGPRAAEAIAPAAERAGFHALWVDDTPDGDSIAVLAAAARVTDRLRLGTGVIAVDRRPAADIAAAVASADLPLGRLTVGIGAGQLRAGALHAVRNTADALRDDHGLRVVVGALGPRMRALAVEHSDGVLLNWLTPDAAAAQTRELKDAAPGASVILYTRTALEPDALARRDAEAQRYAGFPAYAANFARLGIRAPDTVLPAPGDDGIRDRVAAYTAVVDELVLRAITPTDDVDAYCRFIERAAHELGLAES
jgi:alkanesulfonate monooxygenase SsuD/methylene tetrahydromethanopterin reductase-like flavin-dependent oxidoreductase (luciferase family)